jgi:hypothetical protein
VSTATFIDLNSARASFASNVLSESFRITRVRRFARPLAPCLAPWSRPRTSPRRYVVRHGELDAQRVQPWSDPRPEAAASGLSRRERGKGRTRSLVQPRRKAPRKGCHRWQGPVTAPKRHTTAADHRFQYAHSCHHPELTVTSFLGLPVAAAGTAAPAVPTVTIEDVDAKLDQQKQTAEPPKSDTNGGAHSISDGADGVPGQLPSAPAPAIPDWYKIGWREVGGQDAPEGETRDKHILAAFIADQYCGDWYHNAAVIVVVCT